MKNIAHSVVYFSIALSIFTELKIPADPVNINATNLLLLSGVFITVYDVIKKKRIKNSILLTSLVSILFLAFGALSFQIEVGSGIEHIRTVVTLSKGVIVILLVSYWMDTYIEVKKISNALIWAGIIASLGAILQGYLAVGPKGSVFADRLHGSRLPAFGLNLGISRASGFLEGYGLLGVYMESAALLSAIGFLDHGRRQGWTRTLAFLGIVVALTGLLFSQSRSGLVATVVGYGVFYILATLVYSRVTVVRMAPLALIIGAVVYVWPELSEAIVSINRNAVTNRVEGYWAAARAAAEDPIFGIGFSNMGPKLNYYRVIHNSYLNLLAGGGAIAFALYAYFNVKAIKEGVLCLKASDPRAPLAVGLLSALSAAIVECLFWGGGVFATAVFVILGLLISLGQVAYD